MSKIIPFMGAFLGGIALGTLYFGGLWLTVQHLPKTKRPHLLSLGSFVGRVAVTMLGFYWVMGGRWERVIICLAGFLVARSVALRLGGPRSLSEDSHFRSN